MIARKDTDDPKVRQVVEALRRTYGAAHPRASIDAYRYDENSIRVRIIDPDCAGQEWPERSDALWAAIDRELPRRIRSEINFFIVLTPQEAKRSATNYEFENPTVYDD